MYKRLPLLMAAFQVYSSEAIQTFRGRFLGNEGADSEIESPLDSKLSQYVSQFQRVFLMAHILKAQI